MRGCTLTRLYTAKKKNAFATMTAERRRNGIIQLIIRTQKRACWYYFEVVLIGGSFIFQRISRLVYFYHVANGIVVTTS